MSAARENHAYVVMGVNERDVLHAELDLVAAHGDPTGLEDA